MANKKATRVRGRSIFRELGIAFFLGVILLLLVYTFLLPIFFVAGSDESIIYLLEDLGQSYEEAVKTNPDAPLPETYLIQSAFSLEALPAEMSRRFKEEPLEPLELYYDDEDRGCDAEGNCKETYYLYLYIYPLEDGRKLYITLESTEEYLEGSEEDQVVLLAFAIIGIVNLLATFVSARILSKRLIRPIQNLENWAQSLNAENVGETPPNFRFRELNNLAVKLTYTVSRISEFVEREQTFLRYASHELRTPITVIAGNIALLKSQESGAEDTVPVERIQRANLNMRIIVETLLWLGRESSAPPRLEKLVPAKLIIGCIEELSYLKGNKPLTELLDLSEDEAELPKAPLLILFGNLIRNAFQHAQKGEIKISYSNGVFEIENPVSAGSKADATSVYEESFGFGLSLCERIARRMGWDFTLEEQQDAIITRLVLRPADADSK
ncbi:HAMP domain-containing sensor histidine kinase [Pseudovibrio sp. Ad26]|uniref:sensor histidine kinase n=1 Tax=Pseudovibrio sp. Ad26 TaxID=989410 RepID=UPI0007B1949C|nr:HAMP domain-containing sensor histidine kinase [Pseudovibrio sp. Ad26]KZK96722.1 Signal transduction histidine-protein kinase ArlS [Pseudovibrio sp. Ad26]